MKRKGFVFILCLPLFFLFLSMPVQAGEKEALEDFADTDTIYQSLPEGLEKEDLDLLLEDPSPSTTLGKVTEVILDAFSLGIRDSVLLFGGILICLLASVIFESVKDGFGSRLGSAFDLLFLLSCALFCYSYMKSTVNQVTDSMNVVNAFMMATLPISTLLMTMSGSVQGAAVISSHLGFVISLVSYFLTFYLFPLVRTLFCFAFLEGIGEKSIGGIVSFFQKTAKRLMVLFFTVISALLALKSGLAVAADSVAMRSVRFAAGNFIPVVGSLVGESSKTLAASFTAVRVECGSVILVVLLFVLIRPILFLVIQKTGLSLAAAVGQMLGEERCCRFLKSLNRVLDLMLALLISHGCYLIFAVTLFLKTKGAFS